MAESYPEEVSTFKVVGRLGRGMADSADEGQEPDLVPIVAAKITFTPTLADPVFTVPGSDDAVTVFQESILATTDAEGFIKVINAPERGVVLAYGHDPDINPTGWNWQVTIDVGGSFKPRIFSIAGSAGGVVDLAQAVHVPANPGTEMPAWILLQNQLAIVRTEVLDAAGEVARIEERILDWDIASTEYIRQQLANPGLVRSELLTAIDVVTSAAASDETTTLGKVITDRTVGAAPRSLSMSGPRRLGRAPGVDIAATPILTAAQSSLANLYWPQIVDLRGILRSNGTALPHDWAMVYSTDHQGAAKVAIRLLPKDADPRSADAWLAATERVLVDSSNGGGNTETPRLMFSENMAQLDEAGNPVLSGGQPVRGVWLLYFSTSDTYGGSVQHTRIFRSNEVDALKANWYDTGSRIALTVAEGARLPGDGHTGYFNPFRIGAGWYGYSLLGGQDAGMYALWKSSDGLTWFRDPIPLLWDSHLAGVAGLPTTTRLSIGIGPLYQKDGMVYAIAGSGTPASGAVQTTSRRFIGRVTNNFRALVEQPSELLYSTKSWMGSGSFTPLSVFEYGGDLYCPFTNGSSSAIGLGKLVF